MNKNLNKLLKIFSLTLLIVQGLIYAGGTKSVCPSGCNWQTIQEAIDDIPDDLSSAGGGVWTIQIDSGSYTPDNTLLVDGFLNASSTNYIVIKPKPGDEHNGIPGSGVKINSSASLPVKITTDFTQVLDLEFDFSSKASPGHGLYFLDVTDVLVNRCLIEAKGRAVIGGGWGTTYKIFNSAAWTNETSNNLVGIQGNHPGMTEEIYNTALYNFKNGFYDISTIKNSISFRGTVSGGLDFNGSTQDEDYNASSDASAIGANSITNLNLQQMNWKLPSIGNFRPVNDTSSLIGSGINLSGVFTQDITNNSITNWPIGPFQSELDEDCLNAPVIVQAGSSIQNALDNLLPQNLSGCGPQELQIEKGTYSEDILISDNFLMTSASDYLVIGPKPGDEHNGVPESGVVINGGSGAIFIIKEDFVYVHDLEIRADSQPANWGSGLKIDGGDDLRLSRIMIYAKGAGFSVIKSKRTIIDNFIVWTDIPNSTKWGYSIGSGGGNSVSIYNSLAYNMKNGYTDVFGIVNSVSFRNPAQGGVDYYGGNAFVDFNVSSDNSAAGSNSLTNVTIAQLNWLDESIGEFKPYYGSVLGTASADLGSNGYNVPPSPGESQLVDIERLPYNLGNRGPFSNFSGGAPDPCLTQTYKVGTSPETEFSTIDSAILQIGTYIETTINSEHPSGHNLVGCGPQIIEIEAGTYTQSSTLIIDGFVNGSENDYILLKPKPGYEHKGIPDTGVIINGEPINLIEIKSDFVYLQDLAFNGDLQTSNSGRAVSVNGGDDLKFSRLLIKTKGTGMNFISSKRTVVDNTVVWTDYQGNYGYGFMEGSGGGNIVSVYNSVAFNYKYGFASINNVVNSVSIKNPSNGGLDFTDVGGGSNNISSDGTGVGPNSFTATLNDLFFFYATQGLFEPVNENSVLLDNGSDQSALYILDIKGNTIAAGNWAIGPFASVRPPRCGPTTYSVVPGAGTPIADALAQINSDIEGDLIDCGIQTIELAAGVYAEDILITGFINASIEDKIVIKAKPGDEHNGDVTAGVRVLGSTANPPVTTTIIDNRLAYTELHDLNVSTENHGGQAFAYGIKYNSHGLVRNVISKITGSYGRGFGFNSGNVLVVNSIAYAEQNYQGYGFLTSYMGPKYINCLAYGTGTGFHHGTALNSASFGNAGSDFLAYNTDGQSGGNMSEDGTAGSGTGDVANVSDMMFFDKDANKFHPVEGSPLLGGGNDIATEFPPPLIDIRGDNINATDWHVGPFATPAPPRCQPTTYRVKQNPGTGEFGTINAAVAALENATDFNLDGCGIQTIEIEAGIYPEDIKLNGYTNPSPTDKIVIKAELGSEHNGDLNSGVRITGDVANPPTASIILHTSTKYTEIHDLNISSENHGTQIQIQGVRLHNDGLVRNVIVKVSSAYSQGIAVSGGSPKIVNSIVYAETNQVGFAFISTYMGTTFLNCLAYGVGRGFYHGTVVNSVSLNNLYGDFMIYNTDGNSHNNISSDNTATASDDVADVSDFGFTDQGNYNFLPVSGSVLINNKRDLSAEFPSPLKDIRGVNIHPDYWHVGPFQLQEGTPLLTDLNQIMLNLGAQAISTGQDASMVLPPGLYNNGSLYIDGIKIIQRPGTP